MIFAWLRKWVQMGEEHDRLKLEEQHSVRDLQFAVASCPQDKLDDVTVALNAVTENLRKKETDRVKK